MKSFIPLCLSVMAAVAFARDIAYPMSAVKRNEKRHYRSLARREVPQEHSHEKFIIACNDLLRLDNPDQIQDCIFSLLGNDAAILGAGLIRDPDCLHQATADRILTNAKNAGDINGIVNALVFQTLERNTGAVGRRSELCTSITPVNPEIALLQVHQDPASDGAAALNKAITLELARQIALVGGDPLIAIESGTFEPGEIGDPTAAGNTCDDLDDPIGCIFTKNLLVPDASEEEVLAAVQDILDAANGVVDEVVEDVVNEEQELDYVIDNNAQFQAILDLLLQQLGRGNGKARGRGKGKGRGNNRNNQNIRVIKIVNNLLH